MPTPNSVTIFTTAARAFSDAAAASSGTTADPSLLASLDALPALCATAIADLRAASTDPEIGAVVTSCELLLAGCVALGDAVLAQLPNLGGWVVPSDMTLVEVAQRFYGVEAVDRLAEIEANNPTILGLVLVPAGTVLKMAAATV